MRPIALADVLRLTGARPVGDWSQGPRAFAAAGIDSREAVPGGLFFALSGGATDGHDYAPDAHRRGAVPVVTAGHAAGLDQALEVADPRAALQALAIHQRRRQSVPAVAITGSNGKTTTKAYVAAILGAVGHPRVAPKSFNNDLGVPLTLLGLDPQHTHLVCELGTSAPGEIDRLASWVRPDVAVITQIGPAHLQGLGDLPGVAAAKWEIARQLAPGGTLVVPQGCPWLRPFRHDFAGRCIRFGLDARADLWPQAWTIRGDELVLQLAGWPLMRAPGHGVHDVRNALAALAVGLALGLDREALAAGLARAELPAMRQQLRRIGGIEVLDDAYNANPNSMRALARRLTAGPPSTDRSRIFIVIGDMGELGSESVAWHREIGYVLGACCAGLDARLLAVGERAEDLARGARGAGLRASRLLVYATPESCAQGLREQLHQGDRLVLKASRALRLETVLTACEGVPESTANEREKRPCRISPRKPGPRSTPHSTRPTSNRRSSARLRRS